MGFPLRIDGTAAYASRAAAEAALDAVAAELATRDYVSVTRRGARLDFRRNGRAAPRTFAWAVLVPGGAVWIEGAGPSVVRCRLSTAFAAFYGVATGAALALMMGDTWAARAGVAALGFFGLTGFNHVVALLGFRATLPYEGRVSTEARPARRAR